jgi:hypothetical protein
MVLQCFDKCKDFIVLCLCKRQRLRPFYVPLANLLPLYTVKSLIIYKAHIYITYIYIKIGICSLQKILLTSKFYTKYIHRFKVFAKVIFYRLYSHANLCLFKFLRTMNVWKLKQPKYIYLHREHYCFRL